MLGNPRRLTNLSSAMRNLSIVMSDESSRRNILVVAQVRRRMWDLADVFFFVYSEPAKSSPVTAKGVVGCKLSSGKGASTSCPRALLAILHGTQARKTF